MKRLNRDYTIIRNELKKNIKTEKLMKHAYICYTYEENNRGYKYKEERGE